MNRVIVVSKTHLDLGFTDFAETVRKKYIDTYIPNAVELAGKLNTSKDKKFVWTTGSWIIKEALENSNDEQKEKLVNALKKGDIVAHALPFTTHTELLDEDTFDYGLSMVDEIDRIRGKKTVSAKMTDVPGHTKAMIPILRKHGIKLLHIGVNGASAVPDVPNCFLWKHEDSEIVVVYSGDYGGEFKCDFISDILYFDHTLDNRGTPSAKDIEEKLNSIKEKYNGYEVSAGTMDDIADELWEIRNELPVLTDEIGDTWIHGSASDPYKSASLRELMQLKRQWLADGSMDRDSCEYREFSDALLCIAEHTCGMDMKKYFADYENYLKSDFIKARKKDVVKIRHIFRDFPQNLFTAVSRSFGDYSKGSYSVAEKSWAEQRKYIEKAVNSLSSEHKKIAEQCLANLMPTTPVEFQNDCFENSFDCGMWHFEINSYGGIGSLSYNGVDIIKKNDKPFVEYRSFGKKDYDFWLSHYARDVKKNSTWVYGDFGRPLLKYADKKYPQGRFAYTPVKTGVLQQSENKIEICIDFKCDEKLCIELGAPKLIQVVYCLNENGLSYNVSWYGKDANRLTEALYLHLFPISDNIKFVKLSKEIEPCKVVSKGGRKISAVEKVVLGADDKKFDFVNCHSPLVSLGSGKILEYDNKFEDVEKDGFTYILHDNVWGTNFPLWYEDNASFDFKIKLN